LKIYRIFGCRNSSVWLLLAAILILVLPGTAHAQAVPYARTYAHSKEDVDNTLKEFQAYAGQKLPVVDGFVGVGQQSLARYERAFYQFSIELLPGDSGGTIVRLTAKITAWYADPDPAKSGYQVLPSNGRLELDLLDRLTDRFEGKNASGTSRTVLQAPQPKLDLGRFGNSAPANSVSSGNNSAPAGGNSDAKELAELREKREAEEKHMLELKAELDSLKEVQHNQAHPRNLVIVKKGGTPVFTRPEEGSKVLFTASEDDEFEFIEVEGEWFHVQISGASRGWIRRARAEAMDARWNAAPAAVAEEEKSVEVFHVTKEENSMFPGAWAPLQGKMVRIYWVQPTASPLAATSPKEKREFTKLLLQKAWNDPSRLQNAFAGVVVLFDTSDGGQISATIPAMQQWMEGKSSDTLLWQKCSVDPAELFKN
jgi:hypothetical protein